MLVALARSFIRHRQLSFDETETANRGGSIAALAGTAGDILSPKTRSGLAESVIAGKLPTRPEPVVAESAGRLARRYGAAGTVI
jgi:hypothetical protein